MTKANVVATAINMLDEINRMQRNGYGSPITKRAELRRYCDSNGVTECDVLRALGEM